MVKGLDENIENLNNNLSVLKFLSPPIRDFDATEFSSFNNVTTATER